MLNIKEWKPTTRQEHFLSIPDTVFEALFGGAAGGGKSETLLMLPLVREFYKNSSFKGLILRRTYPELERELIIRSQEYYPLTGATYSDAKKRWVWPTFGSYMQFGYAEHEKDVRNYDTAEYNYIAFDELTSFTEFQYKYLAYSRCRSKAASGLPAIVRCGTNPGNIGHGFVRKHFVEPARDGYTIISTQIRDGATVRRIYIPAKATDNPHVDPNYISRLQMLPHAERLAKLEGDWWTFSGQVFEDWRGAPFPDEPENACHVITPFNIPEYWPRIIGIDWGFAAMLWAGFAAIAPTKKIYLYREYAGKRLKISTWATDVGKLAAMDGNIVDVVLDPSAWHSRGDEQNIAEQFQTHSGLKPRPADNDRVGGKVLIQEYLRWSPKPAKKVLPATAFDFEHAEWLRRNKGTPAYEAYVDQFRPEVVESNLPVLQVFNTCEEFIRAIPLCVYNDPTKHDANPEDVAEFDGDDPYDGGRYLLKACARYLSMDNREATRLEKVGEICEKFGKAADPTAFYMQMDRLESKNRRALSFRRRRSIRRKGVRNFSRPR